MQKLATLLRAIANITLILQEMSNRQVAFAINNRIKAACNMSSKDFVDVADLIDEDIQYADLSDADVKRLRTVSDLCRTCNQHLHATQNLILSA
jgi:predicted nucleic acid-binding OB-fold protein